MTDLSRQVDNTLNTERIPIIVVPGLMGTKLHFPKKRMYWNPDREYRDMVDWVRLVGNNKENLDLSQKAHVMDENSACLDCLKRYPKLKPENYLKGWGGLAWGFYGNLLEHLSDAARNWSAKCPVYAVGYDWRQSVIPTLSSYLAGRVKDILDKGENTGVEKIIIVTHSMGGLVTRSALLRGASWASKVIGVLHTVQPAIGAVAPYRRFFLAINPKRLRRQRVAYRDRCNSSRPIFTRRTSLNETTERGSDITERRLHLGRQMYMTCT